MINFTRSFDLAWERMMVILFRPFDLGKWFAIGFSAFLAGFLSGGNGFNSSYNYHHPLDHGNFSTSYSSTANHLNAQFSSLMTAIVSGATVFVVSIAFVVGFAFILLFYWLGTRGQFMFLDNVVRNRGAIAWPWSAYGRQANSLLGFMLVLILIVIGVSLCFLIPGIFAAIPLIRAHRWPQGIEIPFFLFFGLLYLVISILLSTLLFLFRELGVPLMFRNGILAKAAFGETWRLIRLHPGPIILFVLLRIALFIGLVILGTIACCFTCCIGALPYLGTVVLLPALIYIKCFTLDFLAQFGPEYDVWTVDVPAPAPMIDPTPPPPPG